MVWQNTVNLFFLIIIVENFFQKEFVIIFLFSTYSSQPEVSKYCADLMPLLLGYLSSLNQAKVGHVTKAFYALENFMENLGELEKKVHAMTAEVETWQPCPLQEETWK